MAVRSSRAHGLVWLAALYLALLVIQLTLRAPEMPWTVDDGIKWLVSANGEDGLRGSLPYAGRELDPEGRFFPIGAPFARVIEGRAVAQYPPTFALISRPFVKTFGAWGGYVLPLLGALLAAWGAARLAARWDGRAAPWAFLFAGPLGPLAWYGTQFWEHTLVAACVVWAAVHWPRRSVIPALLLAFATWMREESVLFVPAFAASSLAAVSGSPQERPSTRAEAMRTSALFALVYFAALMPFLGLQQWVTGSMLGFHFSGNLEGSLGEVLLAGRMDVVRGLLWSGSRGATGVLEVALTIAAALCIVATRFLDAPRRSLGAAVACALMGAVAVECALALAADRSMPMTLIHTSGLLLFAPWVLAVCAGSHAGARSLAWMTCVAVASLLLVTPSVTAFALHWGPRVLLSALPLLAATAALGLTRLLNGTAGGIPAIGSALLVASCLALQGYGAWLQARVTRGAQRQLEQAESFLAQATAARLPLVTSEWWYAATYAPLLVRRPVFRASSRADLQRWIELLRASGGRSFCWATAARDDTLLRGLGVRAVRSETIGGYPPAYRHRLVELELE